MTLGELNALVQGAMQMHGPDAKADFLYQTKAGRTKIDSITGYAVFAMATPGSPIVRFVIGHARGEQE